MKVAIDVHYRAHITKAVALTYDTWEASQPTAIYIAWIAEVAPYTPGQFYKRELPCILKVLEQIDLSIIDTLLIDGYVVLNDTKKPGLGKYVHDHFQQTIPVIGVAKTTFKNNQRHVKAILRGKSKQPLFITSAGIPLEEAAIHIINMDGPYRIPTLLKLLDFHTKNE